MWPPPHSQRRETSRSTEQATRGSPASVSRGREYVDADSLSELQTATDRAYLGDIYLNEIHSKKYSIFPLITI